MNVGSGALVNMQQIVTSAPSGYAGWPTNSLQINYKHFFVFQNMVHSGPTDILNYKIFMTFEDAWTVANKQFQLQMRTTTHVSKTIDKLVSGLYEWGLHCVHFLGGKIYFGGARYYAGGG